MTRTGIFWGPTPGRFPRLHWRNRERIRRPIGDRRPFTLSLGPILSPPCLGTCSSLRAAGQVGGPCTLSLGCRSAASGPLDERPLLPLLDRRLLEGEPVIVVRLILRMVTAVLVAELRI